MRPLSLSTKMSCAVSLLVAGMLFFFAYYARLYFEDQFKETISRQQFTMVASLAEQLDDRIFAARDQLGAIARAVTPEMLRNADAAQRFLEDRFGSRQVFDGGIYLLSPTGTMFAGAGMEPQMRGRDYSFREYFRKTIATGKPIISEPLFTTRSDGHPTIVFTEPVSGADGRIAAVLIGAIDLLRNNFLGKLASVKIAQTGYLYLYNTSRTMIVHPDRSRILKQDVPPGANKLFDRAIAGFEGSGATVNSRGLHALSSFKHLRSTNWILAANYPEAEAYAPLYRARRYFLLLLSAAMAVTILLVWWFMHRLTAPLRGFTDHVREVTATEEPHQPIRIAARDEIGTLAEAFNRMLAGLESKSLALREEKEFSESLVENSAVPTFVLDRSHRVLIWNRACEELTGLKGREIIGTDGHWRAFYKEKRPCLADIVIDGPSGDMAAHYQLPVKPAIIPDGLQAERWFRDLRGRERYIVFSAAPICNSRGELLAVVESLEDMTERKRAEEQTKQTLSLLSATLEATADGILVTDGDGNIVRMNRKFIEIWPAAAGLPAEGDDVALLAAVRGWLEDAADFSARVRKLASRPEAESYDVLEFSAGRTFELFSRPQRTDGAIDGRVWSFRDISERKRLEAQLRHAQKMEAVGTLAGGIAHDFNTILTAIKGYATLLQTENDRNTPQAELCLDEIVAASDRGARLTHGLRTYSRKEALNPVPVDLNGIVLGMEGFLGQLLGRTIDLAIAVAPCELKIMADIGQLEQVLMNLASNARDAMEHGGKLEISTARIALDHDFVMAHGLARGGMYALLTVADTGAGMDEATRERIFEPFYTTKKMGQGSGLGLAIVYGIVQQHKGCITVTSRSGVGTSFRLYFPLSTDEDDPGEQGTDEAGESR